MVRIDDKGRMKIYYKTNDDIKKIVDFVDSYDFTNITINKLRVVIDTVDITDVFSNVVKHIISLLSEKKIKLCFSTQRNYSENCMENLLNIFTDFSDVRLSINIETNDDTIPKRMKTFLSKVNVRHLQIYTSYNQLVDASDSINKNSNIVSISVLIPSYHRATNTPYICLLKANKITIYDINDAYRDTLYDILELLPNLTKIVLSDIISSEKLDDRHNKYTIDKIVEYIESNNQFRELKINTNKFNSDDIQFLCDRIVHTNIEYVTLNSRTVNDNLINSVCELITGSKSIKHISLLLDIPVKYSPTILYALALNTIITSFLFTLIVDGGGINQEQRTTNYHLAISLLPKAVDIILQENYSLLNIIIHVKYSGISKQISGINITKRNNQLLYEKRFVNTKQASV